MQDMVKEALSAPQEGALLPIIAIGASAGGLEAASRLFDAMPVQTGAKTGMAFIIVQHLDPTHKSLMAELLAEHTTMPVAEASDGAVLVADTVTIIPPGRYLTYRGGALHLSATQAHHGARLPFDGLLASLAENCGPRTVAVVLSGMGGDGSHGLAALKAAGGYVIAQKPGEADYAGMPTSAVETGLVDQVLPLDAIPAALAEQVARIVAGTAVKAPDVAGMAGVVAFLGEHTAHDFRAYKPGTIGRRIERRMALMAIGRGDFAAYLALLRDRPAERDLMARDLLINVTSFFRDTPVFDALRDKVLPDLIKTVPVGRPLRIWVAGCSSGEEAYSLAMLASDALVAAGREVKLQIFASDVDSDVIATAREGAYPLDIATHVPADLLARYFNKDEAGYRVTAALRAHVVFSVQDVLSDPPFSRMDMVSCRNLLIYLSAEAQARVTSLFHFALREGGILLLGSAETIGKTGGQFDLIAKGERIYRHAVPSRPGEQGFPFSYGEALPRLITQGKDVTRARQASLADICGRAVLGGYAPAAVLVNRARQCLFSMGPTERYLRVAPGYASLDLLAMAAPALRGKLRLAMDRAGAQEPIVHGARTRLHGDGAAISFRFDVRYLGGGDEDLWLVAFLEEADSGEAPPAGGDPTRIAELERELSSAQADLQIAIAAQETAHQEQKAINEEALSVNEEFQSTNEELLTSKEELQSLNEELVALNSQLQETLDRQRMTSDDLQNVLYSTNVGTLFLDKDLKIRFFTPAIKALFAVIAGDVGRPLADLRAVVSDPELLADAQKVVGDEVSIEREVEAPKGAWFLRRIFPYRARDGQVQGVVITFADISDSKVIARALEASKLEAERANSAKSRFLAAASHDLRQPLQSLTLLRDLLGRVVEGPRPQALLARFDQTLGTMAGMLNTLLDINQIEAGAVQPNPVVFPISDVFDRLRDEFTTLAQTRGLSLHIVPSVMLVHSDPHLLEQMVRNLLGNAIKYTRHGGILLGCRRRGGCVRVEVWDTGIGIAADQLLAIFDEFHQLGTAPADSSRGLGLGLSIVQRLGILLGHAVSVRSIPDKGSVFAITLPRCLVPAPDSLPRAVAVLPTPEAARQRRIMVVEDDPDVLDLLEQLLRGQGYSAMGAPDADAAIRLVADGLFRPEILLTDFNLPNGANGLDLLASLRARLGQALPAIILSGDISTDTLARIAQADCLQLSKPANPQELLHAIERLNPPRTRPVPPAPVPPQGAVVSVIDDDPQIRATLREVLESDGRAVAVYDSAEAFQAAYRPGGEGCVLVDVHLPGISGVDLLGALRGKGDDVPLILITGSGGIGLAVEAMRMGACDFIEKPVGRDALLASIGRAMVQAHDLRVEGAAQEDATALVAGLTRRQREVMRMVLAGQPSKNIAADLGISQRTVENHRAAIMHRMGVKSLPELARRVIVADGGV